MSGETSFMHLVRPNVSAPAASAATGTANIKIHAPALFQILEIVSKQVLSAEKRIIGTLVGLRSDDGLELEIRDAFVVPCNETGDSITIEDSVHKTLFQLYKKAHPKEAVLGWFGSSNQIDNTTSLIHDFYSKGSDRAFPHAAIYLNVEYLTADNQITVPKLSTYIGAAVGKPAANTQIGWKTTTVNNSYIFTPIPNQVVNGSITEKIAFNILKEKSVNTPSTSLESDLSYLSKQLQVVDTNIDNILHYIESKGLETNHNSDKDIDLLRLLSNNLLNRPQQLSNSEELKNLFSAHNQDVIMIEYLTKAVKDQIELSARLTASADAEKKV
ncbi:hypothetical protein DFJ63DRAFT_185949 [Scheffersomyces coipomensis]|uniref:uncharacterized protein n=1 Tax=Scheffersomyces coipomensis TaxID=1788519 RepID=UPI00315CBB55